MKQKMLTVLICLTVLAFSLTQIMRLVAGESWSWIATAAYGVAIMFQAVALWQTRSVRE